MLIFLGLPLSPASGTEKSTMSNGTNPNASAAYADRRAYRAAAGTAAQLAFEGSSQV